MSTTPKTSPHTDPGRLPMTLPRLAEKKRLHEPIVMVTAYDFPSGQIVDAAGADIVLVGDSGAEVVLGYDSTVAVSVEEMLMLTAATRRGVAQRAARRRPAVRQLRGLRRAGDRAPRSASSRRRAPTPSSSRAAARRSSRASARSSAPAIPVMGHVGLTPQTATALGGRRAQGAHRRPRARARRSRRSRVEAAGAFAIVFEAIPAAVAAAITPLLEIPVIGIGAGAETDGQVLVLHDMLGIYPGRAPRFAKQYVELRSQMVAAVAEYADDVRSRRFPRAEHTFSIDPSELRDFVTELRQVAVIPCGRSVTTSRICPRGAVTAERDERICRSEIHAGIGVGAGSLGRGLPWASQ